MSNRYFRALLGSKVLVAVTLFGIVTAYSLTVALAAPAADASAGPSAGVSPTVPPASTAQKPVFDYRPELLELYRSKKLLARESYEELRRFYVKRFVLEHADDLRNGLGEDYEEMNEWCRVNRDIFEEFCIALEPSSDNVAGAFRILNTLRKTFPGDIVKHHNLAIATAVVWEDGGRQIDRATVGAAAQARAKYNRRSAADAVANFRYYIENADKISQDLTGLPWEALVYIVNHRTPIAEREWALEKYGKKPGQIGKAYESVPYDNAMWGTRFKQCRMRGKDYTLQNILEIGAVCTQRSDFCSRVGACIGIPGLPFHGANDNTFNHVWYTWIDITDVKPNAIQFEIKNAGRYANHYYFYGRAKSPQTGATLFDYEFALDFEVLSRDILGKRQAILAQRVFTWIVEKEQLDLGQQIALLEEIIDLEPLNRGLWNHLQKIVKRLDGDETYSPQVERLMAKLCATFKAYPDVTWRMGTRMVTHFKEIGVRKKVYDQMAASFQAAKRRDLFCATQLLIADILVQQGKPGEAMTRLVDCATAFPDEGRYVPQLLDKIDEIVSATPALRDDRVSFYEAFFPDALNRQGGKPTKYTNGLYTRAVKVFEESDKPQLVEAAKTAVEAYRAKRKKG